jgi:hypothetical protein
VGLSIREPLGDVRRSKGIGRTTRLVSIFTKGEGHMDSMSIARASLTKAAAITSWVAQLTAAVILGQTLFFKFTGAPESKYIFSTLGIEPWGRIGTGVLELITVILLLNPRTPVLGALLAVGLMGGAIMSHLTRLGIEVQGDHGLLFKLAITVLLAALTVLIIRRRELPVLGERF